MKRFLIYGWTSSTEKDFLAKLLSNNLYSFTTSTSTPIPNFTKTESIVVDHGNRPGRFPERSSSVR